MTFVDPKRLKHDARVSPVLSDALEALCERESDIARVKRVSGRLEGLLDAPPSPVERLAAAPRAANLVKLGKGGLSFKLVLSALVGMIGAAWVANHLRSDTTNHAPRARPSSSEQSPGGAAEAADAAPTTRDTHLPSSAGPAGPANQGDTSEPRTGAPHAPPPDRPAPPPESPQRSESRAASASNSRGHATARPRPEGLVDKSATADSSATAPTTSTPDTNAQPESTSLSFPMRPAGEARVTDQGKPVGQPPPPPRDEPRAPDELTLLLGARAALAQAPRRAFELLTQHAKSYPQGILAPEREVLAIDALERMGRTSEAQQRQARFDQQYPESFHLRRQQR